MRCTCDATPICYHTGEKMSRGNPDFLYFEGDALSEKSSNRFHQTFRKLFLYFHKFYVMIEERKRSIGEIRKKKGMVLKT